MTEIRQLKCHCGVVKISVKFENGLENIRYCNCSLCRRKGAVMAAVPIENLQIVEGEKNVSCYRWGTRTAKHYFCKTCGIYTHHQRKSNPSQYGINIACIDGVDPFAFKNIPIGNGNLNAKLPPLQ